LTVPKEPVGLRLHNASFVLKAIKPIHLDGPRRLPDGA